MNNLKNKYYRINSKRTKTNKMTALQTLIEQLRKKLDTFPDDMNLSQRGLYDGYLNAINMANALIGEEKKQIIDARENGRQVEYEHHFINDDNNISSNQYYNQLINKEKWISENKFKKKQLTNY